MPINQTTYERFSLFLVDAMDEAQVTLVKAGDKMLQKIADNPQFLTGAASTYGETASKVATNWGKASKAWAEGDLPKAYVAGIKQTDAELKSLGLNLKTVKGDLSSPLLPHARLGAGISIGGVPKGFDKYPEHLSMVSVFQHTAAEAGAQVKLALIRGADDIAREAAQLAGSKLFKESSVFTRRALSRSIMEHAAKDGVGFVQYANGRKMGLDAYSEMVGRTMSGRAAVTGSLARYQEMGYDLVLVSAHFRTCELCQPWEGKVLSQSGSDQKYPPLQLAIDQGLLHPNCAHDVTPYFPKLTRTKLRPLRVPKHPAEQQLFQELGREKAVAHTFKAQMRQRHIERRIRHFKRRAAVGGPEGAKARAKVNEWRSKMRAHLKGNPYLPRKPVREGITGLPTGTLVPGSPKAALGKVKAKVLSPAAAPVPLTPAQKLVASLPEVGGSKAAPFKVKNLGSVSADKVNVTKAVMNAPLTKTKYFPLDKLVLDVDAFEDFGKLTAAQLKDVEGAVQQGLSLPQLFKVKSKDIGAVKYKGQYYLTKGHVEVTKAKLLGKKYVTAGKIFDADKMLKPPKVVKLQQQAPAVLKPAAKPVPKPAPQVLKPAAPKPVELAPQAGAKGRKVDYIQLGDPGTQEIGHWKRVGPKKGSNPGGLFESPNGEKWYVKTPTNPEQAWSEVMAGKFYKAAGVDAAQTEVVLVNGKVSVASKFQRLKGKLDADWVDEIAEGKGGLSGGQLTTSLRDGFATDAWLANWDVVGLEYDNLFKARIGGADKAFRIDAGGALRFRAQGKPKGASFGKTVGEIDSLRGVGGASNPQAAKVFGMLSDDDVAASINRLLARMDAATVDKVVDAYRGGMTLGEVDSLKSVLKARLSDLGAQREALKAKVKAAAAERAALAKARLKKKVLSKAEVKKMGKPVAAFQSEVDDWSSFYDKLGMKWTRPYGGTLQGANSPATKNLTKAMEAAQKELSAKHAWLKKKKSTGRPFLEKIGDDIISSWSGSAMSDNAIAVKVALRRAWGERPSSLFINGSKVVGEEAVEKAIQQFGKKMAKKWAIPEDGFWDFMEDFVKARQGYTAQYLKAVHPEGLPLWRSHGLRAGASDDWLSALADGGDKMYVPNGASGFSDKRLSFGSGDAVVKWKINADPKNVWASWWENKQRGRWSYGQREAEYIVTGNTMVEVQAGTTLNISKFKLPNGTTLWDRTTAPKRALELMKVSAPESLEHLRTLARAGWDIQIGDGSLGRKALTELLLAAAA